ncbi:hypothetical protein GCM10011504_28850 [Siccirubricoccus deserti]|uniref:Uncharacterized protein n=1 Tax=Siccirubricoccus deserti TaxID=2013562 RepID=A0A9X0UDG7_9PROT|nr:hypothetical protein [Siccirubricoccus deserti]MBC4016479.1 hypothetical protein [Siccirubricoccus deserti]GGC48644.1 hypothetical protein GCM10011504_28850 [Siccirubricoccus deserti]
MLATDLPKVLRSWAYLVAIRSAPSGEPTARGNVDAAEFQPAERFNHELTLQRHG